MTRKLHIDIETYSSIDIKTSGAYKYCESVDFEILLVAYAFDKEPIEIIDLIGGEKLPERFLRALTDPTIEKHAHNANFERQAFKAIGLDVPIEQWHCSAIKSAYCGLPLALGDVSEALGLGDKGKLTTGRALIKFFCTHFEATKRNGFKTRNYPLDDTEKWELFKEYCINDVEAEREIGRILKDYPISEEERKNYVLDQEINDRGILVDIEMAESATIIAKKNSESLITEMVKITGLENPNSPPQLSKWLSEALQEEVTSLAKDNLEELLSRVGDGAVKNVIELRKKASKTSVKKYVSMLNCACHDNRVRGLFQFYGANRTGRWAGRLVQMQNLPRNHIDQLSLARELVKNADYGSVVLMYEDISKILSQLIRTTFIAKKGFTFAVSDFSAIEARVIAWLAKEEWRLEVFRTHGKIYEASASMMFNVPIEEITKGSELRDKGKVSELALGYQGGVGALKAMGGESMGLSDSEMGSIVRLWRKKSQRIVKLWDEVGEAALRAVKTKKRVILDDFRGLEFEHDGKTLMISLPSGRRLHYFNATLCQSKFGHDAVKYKGMDQVTKKWGWVDSFGGKFVENIVQAIARDILAVSMRRLDRQKYKIVMHVHDEAVIEVEEENAEEELRKIDNIMGQTVEWAEDLPLNAEGFISKFYKKD